VQQPRGDPEEEQRLRIEFGRSLRAARNRAGLTQAEVAARLGVTQVYVSYVERGLRNLTLPAAAALARAVGCIFRPMLQPVRRDRR
jgi:transcriptional regulator with XRE-family HTH domain